MWILTWQAPFRMLESIDVRSTTLARSQVLLNTRGSWSLLARLLTKLITTPNPLPSLQNVKLYIPLQEYMHPYLQENVAIFSALEAAVQCLPALHRFALAFDCSPSLTREQAGHEQYTTLISSALSPSLAERSVLSTSLIYG